MNKRITTILLCFVVLLSIVAISVPARALETVNMRVSANKATANPGDTVSFSVAIGPVTLLGGMDFKLIIPEGLTIVDSSITLPDGLTETLDSDGAIGPPTNKNGYLWNYSAQSTGYTGTDYLVVVTFDCTVNSDCAPGDKEVTIQIKELFDNEDLDDFPYTITPATVKIEIPPVSVTGVTIDPTMSLQTGESKTPGYTVNPADATNKTVSFKSSDPTVATVNETTGEVTGVKEGTATITITTADGNFTDTCVVTVACSHANKTPVAEKASDCKTQGWDAYMKCDDCGQLFSIDAMTEIEEIPLRPLSNQHTGGEATCTAQAVCTVCGTSYGDLAAHNYTAETKKAEALKTAGNCRDNAVYFYSCSACGKVENDDNHTFLGDKVADTHVGGSHVEGALEPDHKNQVAGSTGAEICDGCGKTLTPAQAIDPSAHTPAGTWSHDATHHWKECTVEGCGVVIEGSKAEHTSTGANVATCQKAAVCDDCGVTYGTVAEHDWNTTSWEKDSTGHWYKCNTAGCTEKHQFAAHTPDHEGGATEEYAIKCSVCDYEIEAQLAHTHVFDQEVATDAYKATNADCTNAATYFKSCKCGEKGTETFASGEALGHTAGNEWKSDKDNHWHVCTVAGCGVVIENSKAAHTPDHEGGATEEYAIKCSVCDYEIEAQLAHTHVFDQEVATDAYKATNADCTNAATYFKSCKCGEKGTETFASGSALGHTHGTEWKSDRDNHWNECACGDKAKTEAHKDENEDGKCDICNYTVKIPSTGDISMMFLCIVLLCIGSVGVIVFNKKRSAR